MNKEKFIEELSKKLNLPVDKCTIINDVLENNFFLSKKNNDSIINELASKLGIDSEKASEIFEKATKLIKEQVVSKLKNPFKSQD